MIPRLIIAILIRKSLSDRPDWQLIADEILLGKQYHVKGFESDLLLEHPGFGRQKVDAYLVTDMNGKTGYLPVELLQVD